MIQVTELRPNRTFADDAGNIYVVLDVLLNKTAMAKMIAKLKVKNLRTGAIAELSYKSGEVVNEATIEKKSMQFLYVDGDDYVFMDTSSYDQITIHNSKLEWEKKFLKENQEVEIAYYNDEILGISLPIKVTLKIVKSDPATRGDTARNVSKEAVLETGYTLKVPLFVNEGEDIIVRTDTGEYDSRA